MDRDKLLENLGVVEDIKIGENTTIVELIEEFEKIGGFVASKIYRAAIVLREMLEDEKSFNFISFPAAIVSTGLRGILREFIKRNYFKAIITTCGTIDHDIARCYKPYYKGRFEADDEELRELEIHRLGSVFIPYENYGLIIEKVAQEFLNDIYQRGIKFPSTSELLELLGEYLNNCPRKEESIIWWAYKKGVKIVVPGITDGAFGYQIWLFNQNHKDFNINLMKDETYLSDTIYENEITGGLIIGGGISKHHLIWWNQFKDGLNRAVYITTAPEWDGSLSGAKTKEAITWGKIGRAAKHVTIEGEATVILPLLAGYLFNKIRKF